MDDFLPLSVGNSWTYRHLYFDMSKELVYELDEPAVREEHEFTIKITHTEEIDGKTYFVFDNVDYGFPPLPFFFIAGKKVRFSENGLLMERRLGHEVSLFNFRPDAPNGLLVGVPYAIPESDGDTTAELTLTRFSASLTKMLFIFTGHRNPVWGTEWRMTWFYLHYGMEFSIGTPFSDYGNVIQNKVSILHATIGGKHVGSEDLMHPSDTQVDQQAWGVIKLGTTK